MLRYIVIGLIKRKKLELKMLMCENFDCSYYICLLMLGFKMVGVYWFIFMNEFYFMIVIVK